jgi:predicted RNA-binding Zn ribbon-like protein
VTPETLITLANLGRPRRPSGVPAAFAEPVLPSAGVARKQLGPLTQRPVTDADLPGLRQLQQVAARAAGALLRGDVPEVTDLNRLARDSRAHVELTVTGDELRQDLVWDDVSAAGYLARRLSGELAALEPGRLRECARRECTLLFYDPTRSRTRRWHAEDPCGWRERQRIRRATGGT